MSKNLKGDESKGKGDRGKEKVPGKTHPMHTLILPIGEFLKSSHSCLVLSWES